MLVEDGFKFTVGSNEYYYNVWAYGSGKNENISLNYSYNYSHREFTGLSFSDSSLDQNTPTSYHLVGNFPHDSSAQKHAAEKWLNSYGISVNQLEEVLQYAYKVNLNSN